MNGHLRAAAWLLGCALAAALAQSLFHQSVALPVKLAILLVGGAAAWKPYEALLVLAGLWPIVPVVLGAGQRQEGVLHFTEATALAWLAGWMGRHAFSREPLRVHAAVRTLSLLLVLAALASAVVHFIGATAQQPDAAWTTLLITYVRDYATHAPDAWPLTSAAIFAEGLLIMLAAGHLTARWPERRGALLAALVAGAAAAALFNVARVGEVVLSRESRSWQQFLELLATLRVNVFYADRNAAGSFFALTLLLVGAVAHLRSRTLLLCALPLGVGLWLSGSRVALLATALAGIAALLMSTWRAPTRRQKIVTAAIAVLAVLVVAGAWYWYPAGRNITAMTAFKIRYALAAAALNMTRDYPVFGVGLGNYFWLSDNYAGRALYEYGFYVGFSRENAHNNFVQLLAELGVPGFIAFVTVIVLALRHAHGAVGSAAARWLLAALGAYLLTCFAGHPWLVADAALPFWLTMGIACGREAAAGSAGSGGVRWRRYAVTGVAVALIVSIWPRAVVALRDADLESVSAGFGQWQRDRDDGTRYRWMGAKGTFYVLSSAGAIRIPLRADREEGREFRVTVLLDGRPANAMTVPADEQWRTLMVVMPESERARFTRVDVVVEEPGQPPLATFATDESGAMMVGRPEIIW